MRGAERAAIGFGVGFLLFALTTWFRLQGQAQSTLAVTAGSIDGEVAEAALAELESSLKACADAPVQVEVRLSVDARGRVDSAALVDPAADGPQAEPAQDCVLDVLMTLGLPAGQPGELVIVAVAGG